VAYSTVTLTGKYLAPDGTPLGGTVGITMNIGHVLDATGNKVLVGSTSAKLDSAGAFSLVLPATDDVTLSPSGWQYTLHGPTGRVTFSLPASPSTVDIADVTPVAPTPVAAASLTDATVKALIDNAGSGVRASLSATYASRRVLRPVATNVHAMVKTASPDNLSDGVATGITTQLKHTVQTACTRLQFAFANHYDNNGAVSNGPNSISVQCALKLSDGTFYVMTFGGSLTATVVAGKTVVSDPVPLSFAKGDTFYTQTYVSVTSGQKYPLGLKTDSGAGEGVASGGQIGSSITASATRGYTPWAITGLPVNASGSPVVLVIGDSRSVGFGDANGTGDAYGAHRRSFDGNLSYQCIGLSGSSVSNGQTVSQLAVRMAVADAAAVMYDAALVIWGINDLMGAASAATLQTRLTNLYTILRARGLKVYATTMEPVTTSTDAWATTVNQTPATYNADRITVNNWIRSGAGGFTDGYFDYADAVESARDSGLWKANHTSDGTHANATGHAAIAAILTTATFGAVLTA